jgi:hypothetical protein
VIHRGVETRAPTSAHDFFTPGSCRFAGAVPKKNNRSGLSDEAQAFDGSPARNFKQ